MDLIRMYMNKSIRFTAEMRNAIIAYANNKPYSIQITDSTPEYKGYLKTSIMVHVSIDEKKHPEVLDLFSKLKRGQRCAFIKTLTRRYMTELPLSIYFSGDGIIMSKAAAIKLEEEGFVVEGNSLLVNKNIPKDQPANLHENEPEKAEKKADVTPAKEDARQTSPVADINSDDSLNPFTTIDANTQVSDNEPMFNPNDMYIPDDNIPHVNELTKEEPFNGLENSDSENGNSSNTFALFGKLAH